MTLATGPMAKRKTGDKLGDIRAATIAEVVVSGSSAASVNAIAKRAGLAVGTIYRYYDNKDQLLRATYMAIKGEIHQSMIDAADNVTDSKAKVQSMWFANLHFAHTEPKSFLFAELIVNDTILTLEDREKIAQMTHDIRTVIETAISDGVIRDLTLDAIMTVLSAPVMQLGRATALSGEAPDPARSAEIFSLCWRAIEA